METTENQDSIKLNKSSVGVGWEVKLYKQKNERTSQLIERVKKAHKKLQSEFPKKK